MMIFIIFVPLVVISKNKNEEALLFASYIVGAEVFIRMVNGFILYETGKYGVILFLLLGFFYGKVKQVFSAGFVFYILLLLLGIVFTSVPEGESIRKAIIFNLSGPIVLGIAALYFYKRLVSRMELLNGLFFMLLPLFSMITYLYFRTPDLKEIVFGGNANFEASGGFGPNQVATAIGLGIFIITVFMLLKETISGFKVLDVIFLAYFIYRGLLTFSRGGVLTGLIAIVFFALFYFLSQKSSLKTFIKYVTVAFIFIISVWIYTSNITGGMLDNRYTGKNAKGVQNKDITSGRVDILKKEIDFFIESPLGIGVGNGKYKRELDSGVHVVPNHNEITRLLSEHGIIGLFIVIYLLVTPMILFYQSSHFQRAFLLSFLLLWLLTINHSSMRIAFPGFIYALSLIQIRNEK
jgi:O-antigen ligase